MSKTIILPESFVRRFDVYPAPHLPQQSVTEVDVLKSSPLDEWNEGDVVQYIGRRYKVEVAREHEDVTVYHFYDIGGIV